MAGPRPDVTTLLTEMKAGHKDAYDRLTPLAW